MVSSCRHPSRLDNSSGTVLGCSAWLCIPLQCESRYKLVSLLFINQLVAWGCTDGSLSEQIGQGTNEIPLTWR